MDLYLPSSVFVCDNTTNRLYQYISSMTILIDMESYNCWKKYINVSNKEPFFEYFEVI